MGPWRLGRQLPCQTQSWPHSRVGGHSHGAAKRPAPRKGLTKPLLHFLSPPCSALAQKSDPGYLTSILVPGENLAGFLFP